MAQCAGFTDEAIAAMQKALFKLSYPKTRAGEQPKPPNEDSKLTAIDWACVDQEVIVIYDPRMLKDRAGRKPDQRHTHMPKLDWTGDPYYFRQASQLAAFDKLSSLGHNVGLPPRNSLTSTVLGQAFGSDPHNEIPVRMASADEVRALDQPFSTCTTPLIFQSLWMHNLNEWMSRGPVGFHRYQQAGALPNNLSIVLHSPLKIPVPAWNLEVLKPFSRFAPAAFADFSARWPPSTPSKATAEGTHVRCFRRLLVWRDIREDRPYTAAHIGPTLLRHHEPTLSELDQRERPFWRSLSRSHMRVLIEKRISYSKTGTRQFLELDKLLADCNQLATATAPTQISAASTAGSHWLHRLRSTQGSARGMSQAAASDEGGDDEGGGSRWTSVECVAHTFGHHAYGIVHDMWVMRNVDAFITFHGAGEMNAVFLPDHASLVEVRGANASFSSLADQWHPQISRGSGFRYFWWGLLMQDPAFVGKSGLDEEGYYADAEKGNWKSFILRKRDQNVKLTWPHLSFMLERIARNDGNATLFAKRFGRLFDYYAGVVYEVHPGHRLPKRWEKPICGQGHSAAPCVRAHVPPPPSKHQRQSP